MGLQRALDLNYRSRPAILMAARHVLACAESAGVMSVELQPSKEDDARPVQHWSLGEGAMHGM